MFPAEIWDPGCHGQFLPAEFWVPVCHGRLFPAELWGPGCHVNDPALGAAVPAAPLRSMSIRGPAALQALFVSTRRWFFTYRTIRIPLLTPLRHVVRSPRVDRSHC